MVKSTGEAEPIYHRYYRLAKRIYLIDSMGGKCANCGNSILNDLQFAHVKETSLSNSNGRGWDNRFKDVVANNDCYRLLCKVCHYRFDVLKEIEYVDGRFVDAYRC
jgi:5-methylcytosine-specific restriction endonuclease McrA